MVLSTATADGRPSQRTVLLKGFDEKGLVFFTNYESKKAKQIAENPNVSVLFPWLDLERQLIITGTASKISTAESLRYFVTRPFGSKLGAWVSTQSGVITSRKVLQMKFEEMKQKFKDGEVPLPSFWGGYRIRPQTFEFWQGGEDRLHDRFQYSPDENGAWKIERLAP
jgi:pyridoxamine 5'-phosphate oxidase